MALSKSFIKSSLKSSLKKSLEKSNPGVEVFFGSALTTSGEAVVISISFSIDFFVVSVNSKSLGSGWNPLSTADMRLVISLLLVLSLNGVLGEFVNDLLGMSLDFSEFGFLMRLWVGKL